MASQRTTSAGELLLALDPSTARKGEGLRLVLRRAIVDGVLQPGTKLPASRALAADLGVSRGVVVEAYEQLTAEGWLVARHGSGTVVADHPSAKLPRPADRFAPPPVAALDLRPARPDVTAFPRTAWVAATRAVLADLPHADLSYGDHRGHPRARAAIAAYLARVRGVRAAAELVVLTNGFSSGVGSVVAALAGRGVRRIAVEDPGGYEPRRRVEAAGAALVPVGVDDEGLQVEALEATGAQAVLVTPAHQHPMGAVLSAERRGALAEWARRRDGWILEDDYDAEFRYDREPVGAVQGLVPEHTIHLGSVAKTLAPSVRVGWLVVPEALLVDVVHAHEARVSQPATLELLTLAHLVESGAYDRHLRTVRRRYRERRDALVGALADAGLDARLEGVAAGMQAVLRLADGVDDAAVVAALAARGVEVVALSRYAIRSPARGLVIGFGQPTPATLRTAAGVIADVLRST
ncbi:MAG TPA: PLP-dependent aminotransferase family protein [Euzebya sp.]|nr:PLP-dependent aminotransferase family protein [Euzebya sp.]